MLNSHGIKVVINNRNVGENFQDHLMTGISYEMNDRILTGDALMREELEITQGAMHMYMNAKAGPLCAGGIGSDAYLPFMDILSRAGQATGRKMS